LRNALEEIFPELKFKWPKQGNVTSIYAYSLFPYPIGRKQADKVSRVHWDSVKNIRSFFDAFANELGMNPLKAHTWESVNLDALVTRPVSIFVKKYFNAN